MSRIVWLLTAVFLVILGSSCGPSLGAAPRLIAAWPATGTSLALVSTTLDLTFNRLLSAESTSVAVWRDEDGKPVLTQAALDPANARRLNVRLLDQPGAGSYQLRWRVVAAQSGVAAEGEHTFALRDESPPPPRVEVSPAGTDVKQHLDLVGSGFANKATLQLSIGDDAQPLTTAETDRNGSFHVDAVVPEAVPFGVQPLVAADGQGRTATTAVLVRWGGWPPAIARDVGQPGPDKGQVTFTVSIRNRSDYVLEHLRLVLRDPEGTTFVAATGGAQRGGDTLTWMVAVLDRGEVGPYRATYRASTAVVSHAWLEFRHRHSSACTTDDCMPAFISDSSAASEEVSPL